MASTDAPSPMNGPRARSAGGRRSQSERTQQHLLRTATRLFSERGFHGTGIRDIADAAGLAVSAMYYYASSKDELLSAIMQNGMRQLIDGCRSSLSGTSGPSERLATIVTFHVAFHARNPRSTQVIDHEFRSLEQPLRDEVLRQRDTYETIWADCLAEGVEAGEFIERGRVARLALLQMCTGVAQWYKPKGELTIPDLCERFADMGLALMGAHRDGRAVTVRDLRHRPEPDAGLVDIPTEPRGSLSRP
jgi:AcrR family transcriptional regulator